MLFFQVILLFLTLHINLNSEALASIIINPAPIEQDVSNSFLAENAEDQKRINNSLRFGYFSGTKWINITLSNQTTTPIRKYMYFDSLTGKINLYEKNVLPNSPLIHVAESGSSIPYSNRDVKGTFSSFKIYIPPSSEKTYYLSITSRHNINSKVFIGTHQNLEEKQIEKLDFINFYIGGILCLIFYNFFIFLFLKDKNYLYYCFFSLSFMLTILNLHGALDTLFKQSDFSFSHYLICFSSIALFSAILFTSNFLEIPKYKQRLSRVFDFTASLAVILFLVGFTHIEDLYPVVFGTAIDLSIFLINLIFIICSFQMRKVNSNARFYLLSWIVVAIALTAWFGMTFGILPHNFFTQNTLIFANLGQMLILSLALAYRIHQTIEEKLIAEEQARQKDRYQRLVRVLLHDIANSLTIINSYSKKLIKPRDLEPSVQKIVEKINLAAENIKNILKNVREEELLAERKKEIDLHPTNLFETIANASFVFDDHLKHKNIELIVDVPKDTEIMANKTCFLNNVVNNIISNSIKFSFDNSKIEIKTEVNNGIVSIIFRDHGTGIENGQINDIFYSNKLISSEGTRAEVGSGFGTRLMREYVEMFNGNLIVTSITKQTDPINSGTKIILNFPVLRAKNSSNI